MATVDGNTPTEYNVLIENFNHYSPHVRHVTKTIARNLYERLTYDTILPDPSFIFCSDGSVTALWTSLDGSKLGYTISADSYVTYFCDSNSCSTETYIKSPACKLDQDSLLLFKKQLKNISLKLF